MARVMEAARRCEIVADITQALNADWQDPQPMGAHSPHQVMRWGEGQWRASVSFRIYVCEPESSTYVK